MANQDPNRAQAQDPALVAELIRAFNVRGPLGLLDLSDLISPVFIADASPTQTPALLGEPVFRPQDIETGIRSGVTAANSLLVDTGALPRGTYNIILDGGLDAVSGVTLHLRWEHRNAANAATINTWELVGRDSIVSDHRFGYVLEENERIRAVTVQAMGANDNMVGTISFRVRP